MNNNYSNNYSNDYNNSLIIDLVRLQTLCSIKIFKKSNMVLRDINKINNECNKAIKKKLLELSNNLKNISMHIIDKQNNHINTEIEKIKQMYLETLNDIDNLNNIINIINMNDMCNFIEIYSN
jgi:flagellar biosynthesis chaperone FliJ